jgi:calcium-dependent protein kinase
MGACFSSAAYDPSKEEKRGDASPGGGSGKAAVRVDFGYDRDFEARYEVGRLLGHGQFGYTFAATDRGSGDRVAVKRIDKAKVGRVPVSW